MTHTTARCLSGLPKKFSEDECEAYCWLIDRKVGGWFVDLITKHVADVPGDAHYSSLIEFARKEGWHQ